MYGVSFKNNKRQSGSWADGPSDLTLNGYVSHSTELQSPMYEGLSLVKGDPMSAYGNIEIFGDAGPFSWFLGLDCDDGLVSMGGVCVEPCEDGKEFDSEVSGKNYNRFKMNRSN